MFTHAARARCSDAFPHVVTIASLTALLMSLQLAPPILPPPFPQRTGIRLAQENEKWTRACSEGLTRPRAPQMAHMDRMIILHLWGMRERRILKRAREKISNKAPREPIDAMRLWGNDSAQRSYAPRRPPALMLGAPQLAGFSANF